MTTIEAKMIRKEFSDLGQQLINLVSTLERLDEETINLIVEKDDEVDNLTDFLDDNDIDWRLI